MRFKKLLAAALGGLALFVASAGSARADFIPVLSSVTPAGGGIFTYTYTVMLTTGEQAQSGNVPASGTVFTGNNTTGLNAEADYFTIYDFNGYQAGSISVPIGWATILGNTGITPAGVNADSSTSTGGPPPIHDDPNIINLTIYRTGVTIFGLSTFTFSAQSNVGLVLNDAYSQSATKSDLAGSSTTADKDQTSGPVLVPNVAGDTFPAPTPAAAGAGLVLMGLMAMGRRKSSAKMA